MVLSSWFHLSSFRVPRTSSLVAKDKWCAQPVLDLFDLKPNARIFSNTKNGIESLTKANWTEWPVDCHHLPDFWTCAKEDMPAIWPVKHCTCRNPRYYSGLPPQARWLITKDVVSILSLVILRHESRYGTTSQGRRTIGAVQTITSIIFIGLMSQCSNREESESAQGF
jgi:hypothetical protein